MEVLEIAQVEMFCSTEIVIPANRRSELLCVVWEGTCVERDPVDGVPFSVPSEDMMSGGADERDLERALYRCNPTVLYAGDWTGPVALQPDVERSAEMHGADTAKDVVALSKEGVKVRFRRVERREVGKPHKRTVVPNSLGFALVLASVGKGPGAVLRNQPSR